MMKRSLAALALCSLAAPAASQVLSSQFVADGLGVVTDVQFAPGDSDRIFIVSSRFGIRVMQSGHLLDDYFLDLEPILNTQSGQGVLSLAFHPDYQTNGRFFVVYLDNNLASNVVEYAVTADPNVADPNSAVQILGPEPQPSTAHNWNQAIFGPDGMLYVATGDGGPPNDQANHNSQDLGSLNGKMLRIDVDAPPPYIPQDNPFVGVSGALDEIWLYGLRQPWRFSFDSLTGDMYIGDVGKVTREEVDFVPAGSPGGLNFGWRCMEGTMCTKSHACQPMCGDPSWVAPLHEYNHAIDATCIIGGYVYRGSAIPGLQGAYFYGDNGAGRLFSFKNVGGVVTDFQERTGELAPPSPTDISCFGQDNAGELYWATSFGELWKIVDAGPCSLYSYCDANPNSGATTATISNAGTLSIAANDFELRVGGAVPSTFGLFYYGPDQVELPFGDGFPVRWGDRRSGSSRRCSRTRTERRRACSTSRIPLSRSARSRRASGGTSSFWYRDTGAGAGVFNLSDGLSAIFCP